MFGSVALDAAGGNFGTLVLGLLRELIFFEDWTFNFVGCDYLFYSLEPFEGWSSVILAYLWTFGRLGG